MNTVKTHQGSCFCGAVQFSVDDEPEGMGYCHCDSCRRWSGGPVNAFSLWKPEAVRVLQGLDNIASFDQNPDVTDETVVSIRQWCKTCGGHVFTEHPTMGLIDVYVAGLSDFRFEPGVHVHYQETVLPLKDGLPKMRDLPAEVGGTGVELSE